MWNAPAARLGLCLLGFVAALRPDGATAATNWVDFEVRGNVAYFLFQSPQAIARYDMDREAFKSPFALSQVPSELEVGGGGIFYSAGNQVFRVDEGIVSHLANTDGAVRDLVTGGGFLFVRDSTRLLTVDPITGVKTSTYDDFYAAAGLSSHPTARVLYGRDSGLSPSDIHRLTYSVAGAITGNFDSPYHGDYPGATQTWVHPNGQWVFDDSGIVYNPDLTYAGSLGGGFGSIAFSEDAIFVSRDREVVRFNHSFIETGRVTARRFVDSIAVRAGRVFAFEQGDSGKPKVQIFESSAFQVLPPNPPVDPNGLAYIVDDAFITKDRLVYLLSREHKNIFVWSVDDRAYRDSIPLVGAPLYFAHDAESQRVVLAYDSGLITTIPLADVPAETPLVNSPQTPCGLAMAGPYVFVCDPSGAWESHFTYSPAGTLIDQRDWNYYSQEYIWSQANRRMYFFRDDTSPNDLHFEVVKSDGTLGDEGETPYHDSNGIAHPIRVSDDGVLIVLGSGRIYDAIGMTHIDNLGGVDSIDDADWRGRQLFTIRPDGAKTVLDRWTTTYVSAEQKRFRGLPIRLFVVNKRDVLVITNRGGVPTFYVTRQPALPG